jgi:hypothetical protein
MEDGEPRQGGRNCQKGRAEVEESRGVLRVRTSCADRIVSRAVRLLRALALNE